MAAGAGMVGEAAAVAVWLLFDPGGGGDMLILMQAVALQPDLYTESKLSLS